MNAARKPALNTMLRGRCSWVTTDPTGAEGGEVTRAILRPDAISLDITSGYRKYMLVLHLDAASRWVGTCAGGVHVRLDDVEQDGDGYTITGKWTEGAVFEFSADLEPLV